MLYNTLLNSSFRVADLLKHNSSEENTSPSDNQPINLSRRENVNIDNNELLIDESRPQHSSTPLSLHNEVEEDNEDNEDNGNNEETSDRTVNEPFRPTPSTSASQDIVYVPDSDDASSGEYNYLVEPTNYLTNASLWQLLWAYGVKFLNDIDVPNPIPIQKDYVLAIADLLNLEVHERRDQHLIFSDDFQIFLPDGVIMKQPDIRNLALDRYTQKNLSRPRTYFCTLPNDDCKFKKQFGDTTSVLRHIMEMMGVFHYCVPCGKIFTYKSTLGRHFEHCEFGPRVNAENPKTALKNPEKKRKVPTAHVTFNLVDDDIHFGSRFTAWTNILLDLIKKDGHFQENTLEELSKQAKHTLDYSFVSLFKCVLKFTNLSPTYQVQLNEDPFYTIHYYSPTEPEHDASKSAMFKIVEKATGKSISYHRLRTIRDETLSRGDGACHYESCPCQGQYRQNNSDFLSGHVLTSNVLIVCIGCSIGFPHFHTFSQHLQPHCYIDRIRIPSQN